MRALYLDSHVVICECEMPQRKDPERYSYDFERLTLQLQGTSDPSSPTKRSVLQTVRCVEKIHPNRVTAPGTPMN